MTTTIDTDFEAAAFAEFTRVFGDRGLTAYRELVSDLRPGFATFTAAGWLNLSDNDRRIFQAAAQRLWREMQEQQT